MANTTTIILKNSATSGNIPTAANLQYGEIALNYADGILYYKNPSDQVLSISGGGGSDSNTANLAYNQANTAYNQANAAYDAANTKLSISGGTITGNLSVSGSLIVTGNATYINVQSLQINDPLIYLASNNYVSDLVDIGFVANYVNTTGSNVHTGLVRDYLTKEYYLFQEYNKEPDNNHIDPNGNNFTISVLNANIKSSNIILSNISVYDWIQSSFNKANSANVIASASFDKANAANVIASASFDKANAQANLAFSTIVANGTSLVADSNADTLTIRTTGNVSIVADAAGDNLTFDLTTTGVSAATYGNSTIVPVFTVDSRGRLTSVTNTTIDTTISVAAFGRANTAQTIANLAYNQANTSYSSAVLKTGNTMTGALIMAVGTPSTASNNGSIIVQGGVGISGNVYLSQSSEYGFSNTSNISIAKMRYNSSCNSIDFVFG